MTNREQLLGVVIAGGRSLRFGGEKAVAPFAGRPLLIWAVERLQVACSEVAVNAPPGSSAEDLARGSGLCVIPDLAGGPAGPLAGVQAGLSWAASRGARAVAVSPCDVPLLPRDLFLRLSAAAGDGAAIAVTSEGRQPLCAIWPVAALRVVTAALAGGAHPATWRLLEQVGAVGVSVADQDAFANLNTRADLDALEARFTTGKAPR
jgi:molybdopterin-guanine dinucleotide biosynthesis protein A